MINDVLRNPHFSKKKCVPWDPEKLALVVGMAFLVVKFSRQGYKIRKVFG